MPESTVTEPVKPSKNEAPAGSASTTPTTTSGVSVKPASTHSRVAGQPQQFKDTFVDPGVKPNNPTPPTQFPQPPQTTVGLGGVKHSDEKSAELLKKREADLAKQPTTQVDKYAETAAPVKEVKPTEPRKDDIVLLDIRNEFYCIRCGQKTPIKQECSVTLGDPVTKALKQYRGMCFTCKEEMNKPMTAPKQTGTGL